MRKLIGAAAVVSAIAGAGAAKAETTANISLTSDYVFRGVSLSDNGPAIQGGFDWASELLYAGVWGSSISDGMEVDLYAGVTPTTGPVEWNIGAVGYFYPGADDDIAEYDYVEFVLSASMSLTEQISIGGGVYLAPENWGDTGEATYYEINGAYQPMDALSFSAAYGNQTIEDPDGPLLVTGEDDYNTWNVGGTYALHGFSLDLRYHDTDIDTGSHIEAYTYGPASYDSAVVNKARNALVRGKAQCGACSRVERRPLGQPTARIAQRMRGHQHRKANRARRQQLLPFRHFCALLGARNDHHHGGRACEEIARRGKTQRVHAFIAGNSAGDRFAGAQACVALHHDKAPWAQLAVIRHAGAQANKRIDLVSAWARLNKVPDLGGAPPRHQRQRLSALAHSLGGFAFARRGRDHGQGKRHVVSVARLIARRYEEA
jgi:uncharacterized protein (TIGR02001 family)